ncbi:MAG: phosphoethanolamine transferase, partial [Lautropia sp.]
MNPPSVPDTAAAGPATGARAGSRWPRPAATTPTRLTLYAAAWFTLVLNTAFWRLVAGRLDQGVGGSPMLVAQLVVFLLSLTVFLLSFFRFPWLLKPALVPLLLCSSAAAYFMNEYRIMIDNEMLRNVLQTDRLEVQGLLSWTLLAYVLALGVLPAWLVLRTRVRWAGPLRNGAQTLGVLAVALAISLASLLVDFKASAPFLREQGKELQWRALPLNLMLGVAWLARDGRAMASPKPFEQVARRVKLDPVAEADAPSVTVLVVGETSRAANWSLNGYARPTNPMLATLPVTSFTQVSSCGTATAISLPCMFSGLGRAEYAWGKADNRENLLDIAKRAGYRVVWVDNQAGSKGVSARVENRVVVAPGDSGAEASDLELIPAFEQLLGLPDRHLLVVLHQMGSHGPEYHKRS